MARRGRPLPKRRLPGCVRATERSTEPPALRSNADRQQRHRLPSAGRRGRWGERPLENHFRGSGVRVLPSTARHREPERRKSAFPATAPPGPSHTQRRRAGRCGSAVSEDGGTVEDGRARVRAGSRLFGCSGPQPRAADAITRTPAAEKAAPGVRPRDRALDEPPTLRTNVNCPQRPRRVTALKRRPTAPIVKPCSGQKSVR